MNRPPAHALPTLLACLAALCTAGVLQAQTPSLPPGYPEGLYDESKIPHYTLPDPLVTRGGMPVTDTTAWRAIRRPELLQLFEDHVYGRTPVGRPDGMTWAVTTPDHDTLDGTAVRRTVTIYFTGAHDGPQMDLHITRPAGAAGPVPFFLVPTFAFPGRPQPLPQESLRRGYGVATFDPGQVEPDRRDPASAGVRAVFAPPGGAAPDSAAWGALGAWAWGMSRAMDYWGDPHGSFLAARHAEPVYALFGRTGVGVDAMPPVETPVGDAVGYHNRTGGHGVTAYDWAQFLDFADRHFRTMDPTR